MTRKYFPIAALLLLVLLGLGGCASLPRQELATARAAVAEAYAADAPRWAPTEYQAASSALRDGERLVQQGEYRKARKVLPFAATHARRALSCSKTERARYESRLSEQKAAADLRRLPPKPAKKPSRPVKPKPKPKPAPSPPQAKSPPPAPPAHVKPPAPLPTQHTVGEGETLWSIAARRDVYGDALLWPLLYKANRDQIKDPRQIYPGQVLSIPRDVSEAEREESREKARQSDVFPLEQLLKNRPGTAP